MGRDKRKRGLFEQVIITWKGFVRGLTDIPNEVYHPIPATVDNLIPDCGRVHLLPNLAMKMKFPLAVLTLQFSRWHRSPIIKTYPWRALLLKGP
jgi:hypothetical protein